MFGLLDDENDAELGLFAPTPQERKAALMQSLMQAGLGIMANNTGHGGRAGPAIAAGLMQGMQGYQSALNEGPNRRYKKSMYDRQMKNDDLDSQLRTAQLEAQKAQAKRQADEAAKQQQFTALAQKYRNQQTGEFDQNGFMQEAYTIDPVWAMSQYRSMQAGDQKSYFSPVYDANRGAGTFDHRSGKYSWDSNQQPIVRPQDDPSLRGRIQFAESLEGGRGSNQAKVESGVSDKAAVANNLIANIDAAEKILNRGNATGSGLGAARDAVTNFAGVSTDAAKDADQLKMIAGWMVSNVPRMEGPQSNVDVENYKIMAANVGDSTKPIGVRLQSLQVLRELQEKYKAINQSRVSPDVRLDLNIKSNDGWSIQKVQ